MHITRESTDPNYSGVYLYRLVPDRNRLVNGDLWTCANDPWLVFPVGPTNLVTYRLPKDLTRAPGACWACNSPGDARGPSGRGASR